ncbi:hypothetical protein Busp01_53870 [Trinickia caryophylli]|nr:hypothetical protein Busp01_53870 [Trinickia caryophylli]
MSEVDDAQNAVHHGVAQCDDGIHAAKHQTVEDLLDEDIHLKLLSPCDWIFGAPAVMRQVDENRNGTAGTDKKTGKG